MSRDYSSKRWIPKHALPIQEEGLGVVYVYPYTPKDPEKKPKFGVLAYREKAFRADFHYLVKTDADVDRKVSEFFEGIRRHRATVAERRQRDNRPHNFQVGDIVYNMWGYDQTNIDWYRVSRKTKHYVWLQPIAGTLETDSGCGPMSGQTAPRLDENLKPIDQDAPAERHHATKGYISMKHGSCTTWGGGTLHVSWYA